MKWTLHVAVKRETKSICAFWVEIYKGIDCLGNLGLNLMVSLDSVSSLVENDVAI